MVVCAINNNRRMRNWILLISCLLSASTVYTQSTSYTNPILAGGFPDPSICRAGDTYYLVNSSFEYFPGLPIHASKDLVNWELIGYGLHRPEQANGVVNLVDVQSDGGIHAPTIRFHEGVFYIITTNVYYNEVSQTTDFVNFIITADNPAGPWSDPIVLEGAPGIDPDIFFDDDGKVWYTGTHAPENPNFPGEGEIWLQEIDMVQEALTGERHLLWRGACGGVWAEGPHVYKRNGWYYLMIAEGGTSFNHAVMIAISDTITGPYVPNDRNPIFTSRHLSYDHWVNSTGHSDLLQLPDGRWYMVALGIRGDLNRRSNMGRETHLMPVSWEQEPFDWKQVKYDWPVVSPESGKLERRYPLPFTMSPQGEETAFVDDFIDTALTLPWHFRRVPDPALYSLEQRPGYLRLQSTNNTIAPRDRYAYVGIRQTESDFLYWADMEWMPTTDGSAGVAIIQKDDNYLTYILRKEGSDVLLQLIVKQRNGAAEVMATAVVPNYGGKIRLQIESRDDRYWFQYSVDDTLIRFADTPADLLLSQGYTGATIGLHTAGPATSADFDKIFYQGFRRP